MSESDLQSLAIRIRRLFSALSTGVYERDRAFKQCLLAALTGQSVFLLGPPGIGKSLIARRIMNAFEEGSAFEYLMNRFSTPEELFGPLSIQALKDEGRYERLTEGYLPESTVVFLDEIWKAGPAILNTLLTVVNEKVYRNGNQEISVPMRLLITASNELPEPDSNLEPLYDRMLLRVFAGQMEEKNHFLAMISDTSNVYQDPVPPELKITEAEYEQWQQGIKEVELPESVFEKLYQLKMLVDDLQEAEPELDFYVSDRRWKQAMSLLRACAYFNGRRQVSSVDLMILRNCLWRDMPTRDRIQSVIAQYGCEVAYEQADRQRQILFLQAELARIERLRIEALSPMIRKTSSLRGERIELNLDEASRTVRAGVGEMVTLIPLTHCGAVNQEVEEPFVQLKVASGELQKVMLSGQGNVPVYLNDLQRHSYHVQFTLDEHNHPMVKDVAGALVPVAVLSPWPVSRDTRQVWHDALETVRLEASKIAQEIKSQRSAFAKVVPHNFLDVPLTDMIGDSLDRLADQSRALEQAIEQALQLEQQIQVAFDDAC